MKKVDTDKCFEVISRRLGHIDNLKEDLAARLTMGHGIADNWYGYILVFDYRSVSQAIIFEVRGKSPQEVLLNMASAILLTEQMPTDELFIPLPAE